MRGQVVSDGFLLSLLQRLHILCLSVVLFVVGRATHFADVAESWHPVSLHGSGHSHDLPLPLAGLLCMIVRRLSPRLDLMDGESESLAAHFHPHSAKEAAGLSVCTHAVVDWYAALHAADAEQDPA